QGSQSCVECLSLLFGYVASNRALDRRGVQPHAKEAAMAGSQDDWYIADGPARAGFQTSLNAIPNQLPYGVFVRGSVAGVYGEATPSGPRPPGDKAGVLGSSRDNPGVIGTSSNEVGVYGQSGGPGPNILGPARAGVSGTAQDAFGVIGRPSRK